MWFGAERRVGTGQEFLPGGLPRRERKRKGEGSESLSYFWDAFAPSLNTGAKKKRDIFCDIQANEGEYSDQD